MRSLKKTLGLGLLVSLIAIVLLQWWLVSFTFREITENYVTSRLQGDVDMLLSAITFDQDGQALIELKQQTYFDDKPFSGHYYHIEIGDQILRSATLWDQDLNVEAITMGQRRQQRLAGPLNQELLVLSEGFRKQDHAISISVAEDISALQAEIADFQTRYLIFSGILLLMLLAFQYLLMRQTLAPLHGIQHDMKKLARGEIRAVRESAPSEILPLVREVNRLLMLLNQRVERSRRMVGNLAHALKTPLSVLRQVGHSDRLDDQPALRKQILEQTDAMHQRLERELNRARLAGNNSSGARFNPDTDLPPLTAMLEQIYAERGVKIVLHQNYEGSWAAEREDMLELIGNLVDNACKWARSRIEVTVTANPSMQLTVADDGPGCPPDSRAMLDQRGQRIDEQTDGHGLGLAIARDIVDHYNGQLEFSESELGGLYVSVSLPVNSTASDNIADD
ncbi:signal transduction histidine kinase [Methylohalomonas lacus]|uniref:histidine kinase n=1 Tax=Methylohalomonas lacus TaxID=398773 RepID=A0AAE3HN70_9GAMM|nr:ATP-binding protein [Methylohalomonas lacus]MCS3903583.1 signal transduction histidine kinase [Methylohalomonas lacus]